MDYEHGHGAWRNMPDLPPDLAALGLATVIKLAARATAQEFGLDRAGAMIMQGGVKALNQLGIDADLLDKAIDIAIYGVSDEDGGRIAAEADAEYVRRSEPTVADFDQMLAEADRAIRGES